MIEEVSLMVAEHRRRKPRRVTRPWDNAQTGQTVTRDSDGSVQARGASAVLAATQSGGQDV